MKKWFTWTVLEAFTKTVVRMLQKVLGNVTTALGAVMGVVAITGFVQFAMGSIGLLKSKKPIDCSLKGKIGSMAFGTMALIVNIFAIKAFQLGGPIVVVTFITTLSMFFGALVDRYWFNHSFSNRQWLGLVLGFFAGYAILDFPSLKEVAAFPPWVWLAFGNMVGLVFNQWVVQSIKDIHPYSKNVWGGGTSCVLALIIFLFGDLGNVKIEPATFIAVSAVIGIVTFFMWSFSLFAYKQGAYISLKKLVMNGSYLSMTILVGVLWFGEAFKASHLIGFVFYIAAIALMDNETWFGIKSFSKDKVQVKAVPQLSI